MALEQNKSCVTLTSIKSTTDWAINSTVEPLEVGALFVPPFVVYNEWQITEGNGSVLYYQFCGPLIVLLKTFAKHINTDLLLNPVPMDWTSINNQLTTSIGYKTELPATTLLPIIPRTLVQELIENTQGECMLSRYVGGIEGKVVISKTKFINRQAFEFLDCWDHSIYVALLISILAISCVFGLIKGSLAAVLTAIWDLTFVFLSNHSKNDYKCMKSRLLVAIWLLFITLMLWVFSGKLYEIIVRGQIIDTINSVEELTTKDNWKKSKIYIMDDSFLDYVLFLQTKGDPISLELGKRIAFDHQIEIFFNVTLRRQIYTAILEHNSVLIGYKLCVYYYMRKGQRDWPDIRNNYIEGLDFSVSQTEEYMSYHLGLNRNQFTDEMLLVFNKIISRLQESGINEYEVLKSVTGAVGENPDTKHPIPIEYIIRNLKFVDVQGVFLLFLAGMCASIITFLFEVFFCLKFYFLNALRNKTFH